ncbi:glycine betaine/L-proline ABC transporter substrate-binding protein ProX [Roseofilum casamattae]|uniref:Glycine betaine/L-proline ABC transporter substrate-binding protein ProX n=1 Tax=Roseofilum casamattae BLCC-M143 TaxID=3022442 RepID=A0ABT7BS20_9CYAN|nr:glycine betaine/L-proline ABC transporter substrate-binding protein ProX [Roseofilum casamattae]MDJ1181998.1 glycine betaine/L-proline ABC transporter substrate-binding protein ProX [Roseofilum casamattae BLCC-M143]
MKSIRDGFVKFLGVGAISTTLLLGAIACQAPPSNGDRATETTDLPGAGISVQPGRSTVQGAHFQIIIINKALEQLGYTIKEAKELEPAPIFVAVGNADVDYIANAWEKIHTKYYENSGGDEKLIKAGVLVRDALQGYQIDKETAEKYNITSIEQLNDPEIAKLFDTDGNGKANLTGCNPGWGCESAIEHHLDAYGLRDFIDHDRGQYFALMADTITRYESGKPILFYTWTPMWVGSILKPGTDTIWLSVPYTDLPEVQGELSENETTVDGTNLGFAIDRIRIVANKEFAEKNPAARKLFEVVQIPIEDINAQNRLLRDGENTPEDVDRHANEWIANNQELFDSWIETAKQVE